MVITGRAGRTHRLSRFYWDELGAALHGNAARNEAADFLQARHDLVGENFRGERLVIPAGQLKVRSNDTDYRFAPTPLSHT